MCLAFALCVCASDTVEEDGISEYVTEKIMPVAAGVLTSVCALLCTLRGIGKTLTSLKGSKELFSKAEKGIDNAVDEIKDTLLGEFEKIAVQSKELAVLREQSEQLISQFEKLREQSAVLSEILALGFGSDADVVKSGNAREMSRLIESLGESGETKDEKR